jgi:hypothetical protein
MRYLCLVYGAEDSLPVIQNPNPPRENFGPPPGGVLVGAIHRCAGHRRIQQNASVPRVRKFRVSVVRV